jgi:hypothetical protein
LNLNRESSEFHKPRKDKVNKDKLVHSNGNGREKEVDVVLV